MAVLARPSLTAPPRGADWSWTAVAVLLLAAAAPGARGASGVTTRFDGPGYPFAACGVPPNYLVDDNGKPLPFVALNTVKGSHTLSGSFPVPSANIGAWQAGKQCGRCALRPLCSPHSHLHRYNRGSGSSLQLLG